jgi:hypothetical protein
MVGLDAVPSYKRVVAWFPGPMEDTQQYFQRLRKLKQGLDTRLWIVYERKEEPKEVHLVLSIDTSVAALKEVGWRPFSGVGEAIFLILGVKSEGNRMRRERRGGGGG